MCFRRSARKGSISSLRDVADLEDCLASVDLRNAKELARALSRYELHRRADIGFRTHGVDLLNRSLIIPYLPIDLIRGAGFVAMTALGPLRRAVMREGVLPHLARPRLMQGEEPKEPRLRGKRANPAKELAGAAREALALLRPRRRGAAG